MTKPANCTANMSAFNSMTQLTFLNPKKDLLFQWFYMCHCHYQASYFLDGTPYFNRMFVICPLPIQGIRNSAIRAQLHFRSHSQLGENWSRRGIGSGLFMNCFFVGNCIPSVQSSPHKHHILTSKFVRPCVMELWISLTTFGEPWSIRICRTPC